MRQPFLYTAFTLLALIAVGYGVRWNREVTADRRPIHLGSVARAVQEEARSDFPLSVKFDRPVIILGQSQVVNIQAHPFADVRVVAVDERGEILPQHSFRAKADELGRVTQVWSMDSFTKIGLVKVLIYAQAGGQVSTAQAAFQLKTQTEQANSISPSYVYPLVP